MIRASVTAAVPPPRTRRVLHVCESFGAGVASSIHASVTLVPEAEHTILIVPHREHPDGPDPLPGVRYIDCGPRISAAGAMARIVRVYRDWQPDAVHAHSSFAGIYVRAALPVPRSRIVYSPHCFSFEREDLAPSRRSALRLLERAFAPRTGTVVAMSRHEAELARSLSRRLRVLEASYVPDVPTDLVGKASAPAAGEAFVVVDSGRISPQKDPGWFATVVRLARERGLDARWLWIGDGDPQLREELEGAGVEVTGWLERGDVVRAVASGHACLHSAAWETGVPITVLEAAAVGLPVVMRAIDEARDAPVGRLVETPAEAADELVRLTTADDWRQLAEATQRDLAANAPEERLARALRTAYGVD